MRLDQSNILWRSSWGTPMISAMAWSGSSAARSVDELGPSGLDHVVDDELGAEAEVLLQQADHPRREALVHEPAVPGVLGRIGVDEHHAPDVERRVAADVESLRATELARERLGVAVHHLQVGVLGDRPEPGTVGLGRPVHRVLPSQHREHLVVLAGHVSVEVHQVDVLEGHAGLGSHATPTSVVGLAPPPLGAMSRDTLALERTFNQLLNERSFRS